MLAWYEIGRCRWERSAKPSVAKERSSRRPVRWRADEGLIYIHNVGGVVKQGPKRIVMSDGSIGDIEDVGKLALRRAERAASHGHDV